MSMFRALVASLLLAATSHGVEAVESAVGTVTANEEIERLVSDICDKQVVLLGEADHGDGRTWTIKTEIVKSLIEQCGFDSVFFESGVYDFLPLDLAYAGGTATVSDMRNAIGAVWWRAEENMALIEMLHRGAAAGAIEVRGIDDQIHSTAFHAQRELPTMLAAALDEGMRLHCESALLRHDSWKYDEANPYDEAANKALLDCLDQIENSLVHLESAESAERLSLAKSLRRYLSRNFDDKSRSDFNGRDASMYENFRWQRAHLRRTSRTIVWTATIHAAKRIDMIERFSGSVPLGKHIHAAYGDRTVAIGFTALSGASKPIGRPLRTLETAPIDSLESQVLADGMDLRYLPRGELKALGKLSARPIGHEFQSAQWDKVLDGLVVIRTELPAKHQ